jgi:hypothetical protein
MADHDPHRTVDLASYKIKSLSRNPFQCGLAEAAVKSGRLFGSRTLNKRFEKYLQDKLKDHNNWNQYFMADASKSFEEKIKPNFTGEGEHNIKIQGLRASPRHGVSKDFLSLTAKELRENVFDEVITTVQGLVRNQIGATDGRVRSVLFTGEFGRNIYFKRKLQEINLIVKQTINVDSVRYVL